jgi:hypothetical protein
VFEKVHSGLFIPRSMPTALACSQHIRPAAGRIPSKATSPTTKPAPPWEKPPSSPSSSTCS